MTGGPVTWRAAWAQGGCSAHDAIVLDGLLPALSGRRDWAGPEIDLVGLLIAPPLITDALAWAAAAAPSLRLQLHCAEIFGQWDCEATVTVSDGMVLPGGPQVDRLRDRTYDEECAWLLAVSEILEGGRPNLED